jgi:uridylate kinase
VFTTDSSAALRAVEMQADILIKATNVDGVYDKDPYLYKDAKRHKLLSFDAVIRQNLSVMDMSAFDLCRQNNLPIYVCNIFTNNVLLRVVNGDMSCGTHITLAGDNNEK